MSSSGQDRRRFARRLRARAGRGSALLEMVLSLAVLGVAALGISSYFEVERTRERGKEAGRTVAVLANAARHHVMSEYEDLVSGTPTAAVLDARADFVDATILPESFMFSDEMKRDLKVLVLPTSGGVRVLSGQFPASGDTRVPHDGLTQGMTGQFLGLVERGAGNRCPAGVTAPCLLGPGIAEEISDFDAFAVSSRPAAGALMVLYAIAHDDWCGDFLHRTPTRICTAGNRMAQPLTVSGTVKNAASINTVGTLRVHGRLTVGGTLDMDGLSSARARMTVGTGLKAYRVTVEGDYGAGAQNDACQSSSPLRAVCNDDRVVVADTLRLTDSTGTPSVEVRGRPPVLPDDTHAGDVEAHCVDVSGTATVEQGIVRVTHGPYTTSAGSCP